KAFLEKSVTEGSKTLQVLSDKSTRVGPLITGLRQFIETLAEAADGVDFGDGTRLARIKLVFGEDSPCGRVPTCVPGSPIPGPAAEGDASSAGRAGAAPRAGRLPVAIPGVDLVRVLLLGKGS